MSLFGEFEVPADAFALKQTLQEQPELVVEIERVVATDTYLAPYFWVANVELDAFDRSARADPSVRDLRRLDEFQEATLYKAEWTEHIDTIVYAYTDIGATILEADGHAEGWGLRMRFDDRDALDQFNNYLTDNEIPYTLERLYQLSHPRSSGQYGLTPKQYEALATAWDMGFFEVPREATMGDVAQELGIARQSLSDLLRRAHHQLIAETLRFDPTEEPGR